VNNNQPTKEANQMTTDYMIKIELRKVKQGEYFRRKPTAKTEFIRGHYNRKDSFGSANFACNDTEDWNREIYLKPSTMVYIEPTY
jgi:hypothetical protein